MIPHAAGAIVLAKNTGRTLLLRRADGQGWSHPGGWREPGDTSPVHTALREMEEETGYKGMPYVTDEFSLAVSHDGDIAPLDEVNGMGDWEGIALVYDVIVVTIAGEFTPFLDGEHTAYTWADPTDIGPHLHPGCAVALEHLRRTTC